MAENIARLEWPVKPSGGSAVGRRLILQSHKIMLRHQTFKHASQT